MEIEPITIIKHYGVNHQLRKLQEEVFEVFESILTAEKDKEYDRNADIIEADINHIAEEIGDVELLLRQFKDYYKIAEEDIEDTIEFKYKRQLDRMNQEQC